MYNKIDNHYTSKDIDDLFGNINNFIELRQLNISGIKLDDDSKFVGYLEMMYINELYVSNCHISEKLLLNLLQSLTKTEVYFLDLSGNKISKNGLVILCKYLQELKYIKYINLKNTGINNESGLSMLINYSPETIVVDLE